MGNQAVVENSVKQAISYDDMTAGNYNFYQVTGDFEPGALRLTGVVNVVNSQRVVSLSIVVEWDSKSVLVGYPWESGAGSFRATNGFESWFSADDLFTEEERFNPGLWRDCTIEQRLAKAHHRILEACRNAQRTLDTHDMATAKHIVTNKFELQRT